MTKASATTATRRRTAARLMLLLCASALPWAAISPALAIGDFVGVEAFPWRQSLSGSARIEDGVLPATLIDFEDTLGIEPDDNARNARVWFRLGRNKLLFDYSDSGRTGRQVITGPLVFNGQIYAAEVVDSTVDLELLQAQYRFTLVDLKVVDVGIGLGLNLARLDMSLDGSTGGRSTLDEDIPFPTLNAGVTVKPFPGFHIRAEANGMSAKVSGTEVDILDARAQVEWYIAHVVGFFAGYRTFRFNIDDEDFGQVDSTFDGPYAGVGIKF